MRKPDKTALIEDALKKIEEGEVSIGDFLSKNIAEINEKIAVAKGLSFPENPGKKSSSSSNSSLPCPKCGAPLKERKGSKGLFLGCSAYPECRHTENIPATPPKASAPKAGITPASKAKTPKKAPKSDESGFPAYKKLKGETVLSDEIKNESPNFDGSDKQHRVVTVSMLPAKEIREIMESGLSLYEYPYTVKYIDEHGKVVYEYIE